MQDEDGQILEAHSISAGLDYPGSGPEHAWLRDSGRARYVAITDAAGARRVRRAPRGWRGSSRRWRARTRSPGRWRTADSELDLVCLSGRGDKDLAEALAHARARRDDRQRDRGRADRRGVRAARADGRRAALMPYLMGGFPDLETSRGSGCAYADGGADLIELGVPFSDPLADGPVIHAAGTAALRGGRDAARRARGRRASSPARSGGADVLRQPDLRPRARALRRPARRGRGQRADRARPAARGGAGDARRRATRAGWRWCRWWRRRRRTSGWRGSAAGARGFLYTVSVTGTTGERARLRRRPARRARPRRGSHRRPGRGRVRDRHPRAGRAPRPPPAPTA